MSYTKLVSLGQGLGSTGGTTSAIDTTGCNLLVVFNPWVDTVRDVAPLSDSKSNTWSSIPSNTAIVGAAFQIYYKFNPTVGTGHTFTSANAFGSVFPSLGIIGFSGGQGNHESYAQQTATATSLKPGSVTPATSNALVISALLFLVNTESATIDSGFTREINLQGVSANYLPNMMGYKILSGAPSAQDPTWSWTTSADCGGINVVFPGVGGGGGQGKGRGHRGGGGVNVFNPGGTSYVSIGNPGVGSESNRVSLKSAA